MNEKEIEGIVRNIVTALSENNSSVAGANASAVSTSAGKRELSLDTAKALIEAMELESRKMGVKAVLAVGSREGRPIAIHSMDGAYMGSYDIALNKTYTAVAFQMPTKDLASLAAPGGSLYGIQFTNEGKVVIFGGGEPLYIDGEMVGAFGVSGGTASQDTKLGEIAVKIFNDMMAKGQ